MDPARFPHAAHPLAPDSQTTCGEDPLLDRRTFLAGSVDDIKPVLSHGSLGTACG